MFHKRLLKEFSQNRKLVVGMVLTQWLMLMANVIMIATLANFVDWIMADANAPQWASKAITLVLVVACVMISRAILTRINAKLSFEASRVVKTRLRQMTYEKLMRLGNRYHEEFQTSELVQLTTEGVEQLEIYFAKYVPQFFYAMIAPLTLFFIVGTMSLKVAIVLLICVPLIPVAIVAVQKFAKKLLSKYWGAYTQMGDSFLETLQGLTTLKIYQADEHYAKKLDEEAENFRKVTMRVLIMQLNSVSIMDLVAYGGAAIGIILSIIEYQAGAISLGETFFIIMISSEFFLPMRLLGSYFHISMNGNASADKLFKLIDMPENDRADLQNEEKADKANQNGNKVEIQITRENQDLIIKGQNIDFAYEPEVPVLKHVSFEAGPGLTAFVGESGCGKSTIVNLIMSQSNETDIYQTVTRIRHDSYLFAGTVRENLLMGKNDATDQELWKVIEQVQMKEFLDSQKGLDTILLEKASNLSGGQKQRIALARALLHDTPVYIFDEATSNVDVESENAIMDIVLELAKTKTVILISHRLANVVSAKQIYCLKDGEICQKGRHEELMKEDGYYATLYQKQKDLECFGKEALTHEE